jgi:hypothetical protein
MTEMSLSNKEIVSKFFNNQKEVYSKGMADL